MVPHAPLLSALLLNAPFCSLVVRSIRQHTLPHFDSTDAARMLHESRSAGVNAEQVENAGGRRHRFLFDRIHSRSVIRNGYRAPAASCCFLLLMASFGSSSARKKAEARRMKAIS